MKAARRVYAELDEAALIEYAKSGDREAFRAIMIRYNQRLFRVARAVVGTDDEAEDVLQEGYLRAFAAVGTFRQDAAMMTWLTTIVLNEARGRLRKRRKTVGLDAMEVSENRVIPFPGNFVPSDPEAEAARSECRRLLEKAIDNLPETFRLVFLMRDVEGSSVEETARQLGIKPETVKTRLFRARQMLKRGLQDTLSSALKGTFPFLGPRCARITEAVLQKMGEQSSQ
jgi:RNA polymerase sigma factor (sigma-70 family)